MSFFESVKKRITASQVPSEDTSNPDVIPLPVIYQPNDIIVPENVFVPDNISVLKPSKPAIDVNPEMVVMSVNLIQGVSDGNFNQAKNTFNAFNDLMDWKENPVDTAYEALENNLRSFTGLDKISQEFKRLVPRVRVEEEMEKLAETVISEKAIMGISYKNVDGSSMSQFLTDAPLTQSLVGVDAPSALTATQNPSKVALLQSYSDKLKKPLNMGMNLMEVKVIMIGSPKDQLPAAPVEIEKPVNVVDFPQPQATPDQSLPPFNWDAYLGDVKKSA